MKYKGIVFDMDGTVLDTLPDLNAAVNHTMRHFGFPERSVAHSAAALGNGALALIRCSVPEGTDDETIAKVLDYYKPWYDAHSLEKTAPYEGITDMLKLLGGRGRRLCIVTNKQDNTARELADRFFSGLLDATVGEKPGIPRKPAPDMPREAAKLMGCKPEECLYVGDTEVDVLTARNSGMECAAVTWGFRSREQVLATGAVNVFDTVEQLTEFILNN